MQQQTNNALIPANKPADGSKITACYIRLSREDENAGESNSIINQRDYLLNFCIEKNFANPRFFTDDGYSGINFQRPAFQEMMSLVEQGEVETIIVKDHSRLGRNRLVVGALMERFTEDNVRYIAVADNIDSNKGFDDMVAVRELFNEFYPRDISKKIKTVLDNKAKNGERITTHIPYGYIGNKENWQIDPEAAAVVQNIFSLCLAGFGISQIAKKLTADGVLTPTTYAISKGRKVQERPRRIANRWDAGTIKHILACKEYTGCTVNCKSYKKSFKSKKIYLNPPEKWLEFPDTQPAIIDLETWERVQELRNNRRRPTKTGRISIFSGLVFCADCGAKLHFCTANTISPAQNRFICSNYKSNTGTCTAHYIREVVLYDLVLEHLRQTISFVKTYEPAFTKMIISQSITEQKKQSARKQAELQKSQQRVIELDKIFQRLYEDNISGRLTEERFDKLAAAYEEEQRTLTEKIQLLQAELAEEQEQVVNVANFISLVRKYTEVQELTATLVNQFIQRIVVHAPDRSSGHRTQQVDIYYNFIGQFPVSLAKMELEKAI